MFVMMLVQDQKALDHYGFQSSADDGSSALRSKAQELRNSRTAAGLARCCSATTWQEGPIADVTKGVKIVKRRHRVEASFCDAKKN